MTQTQTPSDSLQVELEVLQLRYSALKESLLNKISNYEELDTNRRVEITLLTVERDNLKEQVQNYKNADEANNNVAKKKVQD